MLVHGLVNHATAGGRVDYACIQEREQVASRRKMLGSGCSVKQ